MDVWKSMTVGFMPHGYCLRWDGTLLALFVIGNLGIAVAYFLIPVTLKYFIRRRTDLPYPYMFQLFAAFILWCGLTHIMKVWTLWQPLYWIEASVDLITAGISLATAILLWPLIPKILALRSPKELEIVNQKLEQEVFERKQAEQNAQAARDQAIQASKLKSQFVANISHEIRTPMSGVIGLAELLSQAPEISDETRAIAKHLLNSSNNLLGVLNGLLDFSKLEAGRIEIEAINFSVSKVVHEVKTLIELPASEQALAVITSIDSRIPEQITGDETKVRQVLLNLAHNAVKFTQKGEIKIIATFEPTAENGNRVRFAVSDTGMGITAEAQQRLFEPFVQADATTKRRYGGTGLGLSICKRFVELMSGEIGMSSEEGKGSTFWFTIPLHLNSEKQ